LAATTRDRIERRRRREGGKRARRLGRAGGHRRGRDVEAERRRERLLELASFHVEEELQLRLACQLARPPRRGQAPGQRRRGRRGVDPRKALARLAGVPRDACQSVDPSRLGFEPEQVVGAWQRDIQPVEQRLLTSAGVGTCSRVEQRDVHRRQVQTPGGLRALQAEPDAPQVLIGLAEDRIERAGIDAHVPRLVLAGAAEIELWHAPRPQPLLRQLRVARCVASGFHGRRRDRAGGLMLAVSVARAALPARDDHQRAELADRPHHVARERVAIPLAERLVHALGEAVIGDAGVVLRVEAVVLPRARELVGADEPQRIEQLWPDGVVAGLATIEREQPHPRAPPPARHRQQPALLVVWMRGGVKQAGRRLQLEDLLPRTGRTLIDRERRQCRVGGVERDSDDERQQHGEAAHAAEFCHDLSTDYTDYTDLSYAVHA
jgi:hypothetical protein